MKIVNYPPDQLRPHPRNSRTHSKAQIEKLAAVIGALGFRNPVIVAQGSEGMFILAGHARVEAAKMIDLKQVPAIDASDLTEEQRRAFIIADNRLAEDAGWNDAILREEMVFLKHHDFEINLTGFDDHQISGFLSESDEGFFSSAVNEGDAPEQPVRVEGAGKSQNGFAAFTVVMAVANKRLLQKALQEHKQAHNLPDIETALLHMAGIGNG